MGKKYENEKINFDKIRDRLTFSEEKGKEIQNRLYSMITYCISRHDYYDDHKSKLLQIALAVIGAITAIVVYLMSNISKINQGALILAFIGFGVLYFTSLLIIYQYVSSMSTKYPHREVADIRSWHFAYNFLIPDNKNDFLSQVKNVITNFETFTNRWKEYADKDKFIGEDVEQVFILQILQAIKAKQVKKMAKTLNVGLMIFVFFFIISITIIIFSDSRENINKGIKKNELKIDSVKK